MQVKVAHEQLRTRKNERKQRQEVAKMLFDIGA
jgi:hypothetical protein